MCYYKTFFDDNTSYFIYNFQLKSQIFYPYLQVFITKKH